MNKDDILLLSGDEIISLFKNRELEILQTIKLAYQIHNQGDINLPNSVFLGFPHDPKNRIIALPAYVGSDLNIAGIKWIASFPENLAIGMERASAILILNSAQTGRPQAIMEGSVISAKRTAASASIAAHYLQEENLLTTIGMIGCGLINFETLRFLLAIRPTIKNLFIHDLILERAEQFKRKCQQLSKTIEIKIVENPIAILQHTSVISLATTASQPYILELPKFNDNKIILHTSLRDLSPEIILSADNIVDDMDHVCRAQTSIHLTEQRTGNRNFIRCSIGEIINGVAPLQKNNNKTTIFSPFGLGILDLALGDLVYKLAIEQNKGTIIKSFLPVSWLEREEL